MKLPYALIFNLVLSVSFYPSEASDWFPSNNFRSDKLGDNFREYDQTDLISRLLKPPYCQEPGQCTPLNNSFCFGVKLPYSHTSKRLSEDLSQEEAQTKLQKWKEVLIQIPKCWAVVQPFLCALYIPKCDNDLVVMPSKTMCEIIQNPCRTYIKYGDWPFNCSVFKQDKCKNDVREIKFNATAQCISPLVPTDDEYSYYEGLEGCGLPCRSPFFTDQEKEDVKGAVMYGSIIAFISNFFAVATFIANWSSTKKFTWAISVFYMNCCYLLVSIGYLYQFRPGINDNMICHKDGTLRKSEPSTRENLSCVTSFVFVYYFFIAGIVWFVIFAYAWHLKLKGIERGVPVNRKDKKSSYYHLVAWSLPLILTITILAFGEVDGDDILGVCTVGVVNKHFKLIFVVGPLCCSVIGVALFLKGVISLLHLKFTSKQVITPQGSARICGNITRVMIFSSLTMFFGMSIFSYHIYDFQNHQLWKDSLGNYIMCELLKNSDDLKNSDGCSLKRRPNIYMVMIYLLGVFGNHVNMASWVLTSTTVTTWIDVFKRLLNKAKEEPVTHKRHKLIAQAYAKRKCFSSEGRMSIRFSDSKEDPVGLNFDLESKTSVHSSLTWAQSLPKLIKRRGALFSTSSISSQRRNSVDSQISYSVRRVSVESRRHSLDSTVSVQAVEVTKTVRKRPKRIKRKGKKDYRKNEKAVNKMSNITKEMSMLDDNVASSISQAISEIEAEVMKTLNILQKPSTQLSYGPNLNRRPAICGIEETDLALLQLLPSATNVSGSEDESQNSESVDS